MASPILNAGTATVALNLSKNCFKMLYFLKDPLRKQTEKKKNNMRKLTVLLCLKSGRWAGWTISWTSVAQHAGHVFSVFLQTGDGTLLDGVNAYVIYTNFGT